jgi:putative peptidoglycan lipid II flippase
MSLARSTLVQASFTLFSRILGFARDRAISNTMGAGWIGDAFATAMMFPNLFRRVLAEGAFSQAFVPVYAKTRKEIGQDEAVEVASDSFSVLALAAAVVTIVAQLAMPWIMLIVHGGYADQRTAFDFAVVLTQITMPYLVMMSVASLLAGILNTAGRFALTAAAPTLMNLVLLAAVLISSDARNAAIYAAWAITLSGLLQAGALYLGCRHLGVRIGFRWPRLTPRVKTILALMGPSVIAGSATQINIFASQALASFEVGAKSWLYAADRLFQLPLGLIGVAIGVALLPRLAQAVATAGSEDDTRALDEAMVLSMAFAIPATAALVVMPYFMMHGFWTGGQFTDADSRATANALFVYGWGVPAFILVRILAPPFFAREDTKRPMNFALISVVLNVAVGASAFFALRALGLPGYVGLAVGTTVAAWTNAGLLAFTLLKERHWRPEPWVWGKLTRIGIAAAIMSAAVGAAAIEGEGIHAWFEARMFAGKEIGTLLVCLGGLAVYAASAFAVRAVTMADVKKALRKPEGAPAVLPGDPLA